MKDLIFDRVGKSFGEKTVLRDFSLTVPAGGRVCLMGPSGCGKTTLLSMAAGLLQPDSGTISGVPERISVVFQEDRLCEDFSVLSNLRAVTGKSVSRETMLAHLRELGIADAAGRPVRELSGGMKRRAAIARAALYAGDLFLLDEPLKGLDEKTRGETLAYLLRHTAGKTVLFVTHSPAEAAQFGGALVQMAGAK
jgi:NitT/TauT family transport system ATP-binding protein